MLGRDPGCDCRAMFCAACASSIPYILMRHTAAQLAAHAAETSSAAWADVGHSPPSEVPLPKQVLGCAIPQQGAGRRCCRKLLWRQETQHSEHQVLSQPMQRPVPLCLHCHAGQGLCMLIPDVWRRHP